jgi:hypothetical protein
MTEGHRDDQQNLSPHLSPPQQPAQVQPPKEASVVLPEPGKPEIMITLGREFNLSIGE